MAACSVLLLAGLGADAGTLTGRAGPFALELAVHPDPPVVGENHVTIIVRHGGGRVPNATVEITARAEDAETEAVAVATGQPGEYLATVTLPQAARYVMEVGVSAGERPVTGSATFRVSTGNPVWQADPGAVRAFWIGLGALLLALAVLGLVPVRPERRDRKAFLSAAILLIGAWLLARHAVATWRRPGQMDVIEAQAMDMTAMKPPIGTVPVQVEEVGYRDFGATVTYTGSVVPYREQAVRARVTGWIVAMPVYPGDSVTSGAVLARLDQNELSDRARQAIAEREVASARAAAARAETVQQRRRIEELRATAAAAQARIREATSRRDEAAAALERARSDRQRAAAMEVEARRQVAASQAGERSATAMTRAAEAETTRAGAERSQAGTVVAQARQAAEAARRMAAQAEREVAMRQAGAEQAAAQLAAVRQTLPQAEAEVAAARADLNYWRPELARMKALLDQGAVSQEEHDREAAQADAAAAAVRRLEARVQATRADMAAAEAAVKQSWAAVEAAEEAVAARQAEVQAAQSRIAEAEAMVEVRVASLGAQSAATDSRAARGDEAAAMIGMSEARVDRARAEVAAAGAAIREAEQRLAAWESGVRQAEAEARAAERAIATGQAEAEAAAQRAAAAGRDIGAKQAAVDTQQTILGYTTLRAELDGVVTERTVSPPTLVQPGDVLLRVAEIDRVRLQANVAASDARLIREGARVRVTTPKSGGRVDEAVVTSVFPAADPASRTAIVEAVLDNPDRFYLPGDPLTLEIAQAAATESLTLPQTAIGQRVAVAGAVTGEVRPVVWTVRGGTGGKTEYYCTMHPQIVQDEPGLCPICKMDLVPRQVAGGEADDAETEREWYCTMHPQIVEDEPGLCSICKMDLVPRTLGGAGGLIAHQVPVTLGHSGGGRVEILEGLKPGDKVIVAGFADLREGDRVRIFAELSSTPALGEVIHAESAGDAPPAGHGH